MKIITRQIEADEAPASFEKQYGRDRDGKKWINGRTRDETIDALNALPKPVNADEVDRIIGNDSWTRVPTCDDCGKCSLDAVMQLGQEPDWESCTAHICHACLKAALDTIEKATP
ncbi:hypothetical protein [Pseudomonas sp.]|uniref:hypothetical protein n=1 Tax=Pseudomonas sp. TaxID=306 RepID=UPI003FD8194C